VARIAEAISQTFRSIRPDSLADRLFGDSLDDWWQECVQGLAGSEYASPVQSAFFITTFSAMGAIAKVDGRIQESEITYAASVMDYFNLQPDYKRLAIRLFNEGKQSDFNLDAVLTRFYKSCHHRVSVLHLFVEIQLKLAFADSDLNAKEKNILQRIGKRLDISKSVLQRIEYRATNVQKSAADAKPSSRPMGLTDACAILGVSRWSKQKDIKLAYRRLMSQYHPDKLLARNSSKEQLDQATEKAQQIKNAYEMICKIKKFR